jgi:hypothetical protein
MSDTQEYEKAAATSPTTVAAFATHDRSMVKSIQHGLHQTPWMVPAIVLVGSILVFGLLLGQKFFSPFALTLILQQVQIVGILGCRPVTRDPDGRHRPLGRRHHGDLIRLHGAVHLPLRPAARNCGRAGARRGNVLSASSTAFLSPS